MIGMRRLVAAFLAVGLGGPGLAADGDLDVGTLTECLIAGSTQAETDTLKRLMVAALTEDLPAFEHETNNMALALVSIATNRCGIRLAELEKPRFREAAVKYGERLGQKIMAEAFAKVQ
jgi:hypothetical protein